MNRIGLTITVISATAFVHASSVDRWPVCARGKWGYINVTGKIVIEPKYDHALPFREGIGTVGTNGRWGAIDTSGKVRVPAIYRGISPCVNGTMIAMVSDRECYLINTQGKKLGRVSLNFDLDPGEGGSPTTHDLWPGLNSDFIKVAIDKLGRDIELEGNNAFAKLRMVTVSGRDASQWTFKGKPIGPICYGMGYAGFHEGRGLVWKGMSADGSMDNILYGFIDEKGKEVIKRQFAWTTRFHGGLAMVGGVGSRFNGAGDKILGPWGYIDRSGRKVWWTSGR